MEDAGIEGGRGGLTDSDARLRAILETAVEGILSIDERGIVEAINPAAERMFGYAAPEVLGRNVSMLMPSPYEEEHDGYLAAYLATGAKKIIGIGREVQGRRRDGTVFPLHLAVSEVRFGTQRTFTGFIRDLTEAKRLEQEFLHSQKMEAVGSLAGGIAHDFNNLLMGILAYSRVTAEELEPGPTRAALEEIGAAANRGIALTRRLLAFSRGRTLRLEPTSIDDVVRANESMLRQVLTEDVELDFRLEAQARVLADPGLIKQILINLLINARDALPVGGGIRVRTRASGSEVVLEVQDDGCGMPPEVAARIFEPFFTTKAPGKGTGLGLSTVQRIVGQLSGRIELASEVGRGTTFRLVFPRLEHGQPRESVPPARGPARLGRCSILLVEDDRLVRASIQRWLATNGYDVRAAEGPAEALAAVRADGPFDVLLTDIVMPGASGTQLAAQVLALFPGIQVVFMSAHEPEMLIETHRLPRGAICLQKPFELEALLGVLESLEPAREPATADRPARARS